MKQKSVGKVKYGVVLVGGFIFLCVAIFWGYWWWWEFQNTQQEKVINTQFHTEVKQYPQVTVKNFTLWEGDSMVTLDIKGKGEVKFWYGVNGVPRIESIGKYGTDFDCFYVDTNGKKTGYAYTTGLDLSSNTAYKKWFPFHVYSIGDLLKRHDAIIGVLNTFPHKPFLKTMHDGWGEHSIRKNPDPRFILYPEPGKPIQCDLFLE